MLRIILGTGDRAVNNNNKKTIPAPRSSHVREERKMMIKIHQKNTELVISALEKHRASEGMRRGWVQFKLKVRSGRVKGSAGVKHRALTKTAGT